MTLTRTTVRRTVLAVGAAGLLAGAPPASAVELPGEIPPLPGLPGAPALPGTGDIPSGELPGGLGDVLSGAPTGSGADVGDAAAGSGGGGPSPSGAVDTGGLDPVISGPSRALTVRVDSKGRFRVAGVAVACPVLSPAPCDVAVRVASAGGRRVKFVNRHFGVKPGASLRLEKLKLSKRGLGALREMRVARVVVAVAASRPGGVPRARAIGLKLKPARR